MACDFVSGKTTKLKHQHPNTDSTDSSQARFDQQSVVRSKAHQLQQRGFELETPLASSPSSFEGTSNKSASASAACPNQPNNDIVTDFCVFVFLFVRGAHLFLFLFAVYLLVCFAFISRCPLVEGVCAEGRGVELLISFDQRRTNGQSGLKMVETLADARRRARLALLDAESSFGKGNIFNCYLGPGLMC